MKNRQEHKGIALLHPDHTSEQAPVVDIQRVVWTLHPERSLDFLIMFLIPLSLIAALKI